MKKIIILCSALTIFLTVAFAKANPGTGDKIIGIYWSPNKDAKIEIYKKGDRYFGKSIWTATKRKDLNNPNPTLRDKDLLGAELFKNFSYKDGAYEDGEIYDPESGKTYDCKMTLSGKTLKVRGYIGISLFGRTEVFERIM